MLEGNLLCDMAVGSGKTFTAVALIMELRRMGLLGGGKAMVVVPNHLVVQWRSEAALLYPAARVIAAEKRDLERLNRRRFFGTIAANDADLIILPMSAYPFIEPPAEFTTQLLGEQVTELEHALQMMDKDARFSRRRIEKRLATLRGKIERLVKRPRRDLALGAGPAGCRDRPGVPSAGWRLRGGCSSPRPSLWCLRCSWGRDWRIRSGFWSLWCWAAR